MIKLTKSQRKYVRMEKAEIRRNFSTKEERLEQVDQLYKKFGKHAVKEPQKVVAEKPKPVLKEKPKEAKKEKAASKDKKTQKNDNSGNLQPGDK